MRIRPLLPLLLSTVAVPAIAGDYKLCLNASDFVSCLIEQDEFARQRNAEIDASIARVQRARARDLAQMQCAGRYARTPQCTAEREQRFAAHQNALAAASVVRVAEARAFEAARNAENAASVARVAAQRARRLETEQNALIEASLAAVNTQRERRFAAQQNALATASIERVKAEQHNELLASLSACSSDEDTRPRCEAERARELAAQQNALATASAERVRTERERAFAAARNAEVNRSIAAVAGERRARMLAAHGNSQMETGSLCQPNWPTAACTTDGSNPGDQAANASQSEYAELTSHCAHNPESPRCEAEQIREFAAARNAEINASIAAVQRSRTAEGQGIAGNTDTHTAYASYCAQNPDSWSCQAQIEHEFQAARNSEIERSIAAVARARASGELNTANQYPTPRHDTSPVETGTIGSSPLPLPQTRTPYQMPESTLRQSISTDPCRVTPIEPVQFTRGAQIDAAAKPELDRLAQLARTCPGVRIEVHAYADGNSHFSNRSLSQARAQAIAHYLVAAGVANDRITAVARGGAYGATDNFEPGYGHRAEFVVKNPSTDAAARRVMWDLAELLDPNYIPAVANLSP